MEGDDSSTPFLRIFCFTVLCGCQWGGGSASSAQMVGGGPGGLSTNPIFNNMLHNTLHKIMELTHIAISNCVFNCGILLHKSLADPIIFC